MTQANSAGAQVSVWKFGGSSLADGDHYRHVARLITDWTGAQADRASLHVVVSAQDGVTDALQALISRAASGRDYLSQLQSLLQQQQALLGELNIDLIGLDEHAKTLESLCHTIAVTRSTQGPTCDYLLGMGEVWSARILSALIQSHDVSAQAIDARDWLTVMSSPLGPVVDWEASEKLLDQCVQSDSINVITGYVARLASGQATNLGRNGSDYSAAILAKIARAQELVIWTDVDGVMSADPRLVPDALILESLSFDEAAELAYFGAQVLHPKTFAPAVAANIPIRIRNTNNPEHPGSVICGELPESGTVRGVSVIRRQALINVEGAGMIGVPGIAQRVFDALRQANISVSVISQASSEHSICLVVPQPEAESAQHVLQSAFAAELHAGQIQSISVQTECSVLAVVGDGMSGQVGVAAKLFSALARAGVNIRAIAQGSSQRNISVVIGDAFANMAVRAVHSAFYLSPQTLSLGLLGVGHVGSALLEQLTSQVQQLADQSGLDIRLRALADSRRMLLDDHGMNLDQATKMLEESETSTDLAQLAGHLDCDRIPHTVIIDCSASDDLAAMHADWLGQGIHVITPNKKAGAGPLAGYQALRKAQRRGGLYFYETTVGAGLPVIQTLKDLRDTGDDIHAIEGMFSGTLAYLFNGFDGTEPFSARVRDAWQNGYTEPDPRDDLSGMDVARKLVILAREMGLDLSVEDVQIESLVPSGLDAGSPESFVDRLVDFDDAMQERFERVRSDNKVLRYVGRVDAAGNAQVGLAELDIQHAFANARLTDNVIQFQSARYADNPLVIQGPGAGPEVTAAGVFADLLRLAGVLGARLL